MEGGGALGGRVPIPRGWLVCPRKGLLRAGSEKSGVVGGRRETPYLQQPPWNDRLPPPHTLSTEEAQGFCMRIQRLLEKRAIIYFL